MGMYSSDDRSASEYSVIGLMWPLIQECNHVDHKLTIYRLDVSRVCVKW